MMLRVQTRLTCIAGLICLTAPLFAQKAQTGGIIPSAPNKPVVVENSPDTAAEGKAPVVTFSSQSQLVVVPVSVTRDGVPVTGLKKDQFKILENGRERKIAVFEEVKADDTAPVQFTRTVDRETKTFSNLQVGNSAPKRLVVIVLDLINTNFQDRIYARQQLIKFLSKNVDSGALISLVALGRGRVKIIHDFTSRPEVLVAALDRASKKGEESAALSADLGVAESQVFESEVNQLSDFLDNGHFSGSRVFDTGGGGGYRWLTIRQTLDGLNLIAQAYAGIPGRKALIWATGGFPFQIDGSTMLLDPSQFGNPSTEDLSDVIDYYEHTWQLMNQANFAMYPVDLRGLVVNNISASERVDARNVVHEMQRRSLLNTDTLATFGTFADMTGGRAFYNTNDLAGAFKKATVDSASYYMLAYYLDKSTETGKKNRKNDWRKLKVHVNAPNINVRSRSGFFANGDQPSYKSEMQLALASPLDFTALPVTVHWLDQVAQPTPPSAKPQNAQNAAPQKKAGFEIFVPASFIAIDSADNNKMSVEVVTSARTSAGVEINGVAQTVTGHLKPETLEKMNKTGFMFKSDISLPPGRYSVRFVVRDNIAEKTGSVAAPLVVR
jgi:VWFA-related protein